MIGLTGKIFRFFAQGVFLLLYLAVMDTVLAMQVNIGAKEQFLSESSLGFVSIYNKIPSTDEIHYIYEIGAKFCDCRFTYGDDCISRFTKPIMSENVRLQYQYPSQAGIFHKNTALVLSIVSAANNYLCTPVGVSQTLPPRIIFGYSSSKFTNKSFNEYLKVLKQYLYIRNRYQSDPKISPIPSFLSGVSTIESYTDIYCTDRNRGILRDQWVTNKVEEIYKQRYNDLGIDEYIKNLSRQRRISSHDNAELSEKDSPNSSYVNESYRSEAELNAKTRLDAYFRAITNGAISYVCVSSISSPSSNNLSSQTLSTQTAIELVQNYYDLISKKNYKSVKGMVSSGFTAKNEEFFNRFQKVTASNLKVQSENNQTIRLVGVVTYVYRSGTVQREERTFSIRMVNNRPVIVDTAFVRNLRN